jgi:hypothetical protein
MAELQRAGFSADAVFNLSDMLVAFSAKSREIAFANVAIRVFPSDRRSYTGRVTIVEPFDNLAGLDVWMSPNLIALTVHFISPIKFESRREFAFTTTAQSRAQVRALVNAWPGGLRPSVHETSL